MHAAEACARRHRLPRRRALIRVNYEVRGTQARCPFSGTRGSDPAHPRGVPAKSPRQRLRQPPVACNPLQVQAIKGHEGRDVSHDPPPVPARGVSGEPSSPRAGRGHGGLAPGALAPAGAHRNPDAGHHYDRLPYGAGRGRRLPHRSRGPRLRPEPPRANDLHHMDEDEIHLVPWAPSGQADAGDHDRPRAHADLGPCVGTGRAGHPHRARPRRRPRPGPRVAPPTWDARARGCYSASASF